MSQKTASEIEELEKKFYAEMEDATQRTDETFSVMERVSQKNTEDSADAKSKDIKDAIDSYQKAASTEAQILIDFNEKNQALKEKTTEQSLEHYSSNIDELINDIKENEIMEYVRVSIINANILLKADKDTTLSLLQFTREIILYPYLQLIREKDYHKYEEITEFIDEAFKNSEKIIQDAEKNDTKQPIISFTTRKATELKAETTKIGRLMKNPQDRDDFYDPDRWPDWSDRKEKGCKIRTGKYHKRDIITYAALEINKDELKRQGVEIVGRLEPFDIEILTHAFTLYEIGNEYMTFDMLYRQITNDTDAKLTPKMRMCISDSLAKLSATNVYINAEQEFDAGYNKKTLYRGPLLPNEQMQEVIVKLNGRFVKDCVHILGESMLYKYAESKNQITRIPVNMLYVPGVNNTEENIVIKGYLMRFVADMRNSKNGIGNVIRYDTLFDYLGIDGENKQVLKVQKMRIHQTVRTILKTWKNNEYIGDFQEIKEGIIIAKIKITL